MPVLNVSDFQIAVDTVQKTEHALGIKDSTGAIYYAPIDVGNCPSSLKVRSGDTVYTVGQSNLYQSVTSIDTCETISLPPGCYTVVLVGGRGGDGGNNTGTGGNAVEQTFSFNITQTTNVYAFRGGDGAGGGFNESSGGVTSGGGGGSVSAGGTGLGSTGADALDASGFVCSAGGGGAVGGAGGAETSGFLYNGAAGTAAGDNAGGAGGNSSMGGLFGSASATGGTGGANVSYTCGGVTFYSYGGGGGGAVSTGGLFGAGVGVNGGNGGSGSSGASSTSFVMIYRFG